MVFAEQGIAMLSSVLSSKTAIHVNIQIMRVFTSIRKVLSDTSELRLMIEQIKQKKFISRSKIEKLIRK